MEVTTVNAGFILSTLFEIALVAFVIFGLFNESRFAETERRVFRFLKRRVAELLGIAKVKSKQY